MLDTLYTAYNHELRCQKRVRFVLKTFRKHLRTYPEHFESFLDRSGALFQQSLFSPKAWLNKQRLYKHLEFLEHLREEFGRPLRVLDLGCRGGLLTCLSQVMGHQVIGIEERYSILSAQALAQALELWVPFSVFAPGWQHAVEEVLEGKPDLVFLSRVLHEKQHPDLFLKELRDFLPADTMLLIEEVNPHSPWFWLLGEKQSGREAPFSVWKRLFQLNGFHVSDPYGLDWIPGTDYLFPDKCLYVFFSALRRNQIHYFNENEKSSGKEIEKKTQTEVVYHEA